MGHGCSMTDINSNLLRMLQRAGKDPLTHHDWISGWRTLHDELEKLPDSSRGFAEIEHAALSSISNIRVSETHTHLNSDVCRMLNTFKHPAFLVGSDGIISAQNVMVRTTYDLDIGDHVEDLPVILKLAESLEDIVKDVTSSRSANGKAIFKQAFSLGSTHELTLAITRSNQNGGAAALVFIISTKFSEKAADFIKSHYDLTTAESQVLISFVEGYSLKEIANDRARSYATIRTQFNALMTKMGAHDQATLLRTVLSLSDFNKEIDKLSAVLEHPFRRPANIMRDGGRMVDVCFSGDLAGTPLLHIPTAAANRFNASIEEFLFKAGLYMITVCPPAHGKTDPPPSGSDRRQCQVEDIEAVLDMLNIEDCPVMVTSAGTYGAFDLASALPNKISQILLVAATPPGAYWLRYGTGAPWVDAVFRMDEKFSAVRKLVGNANLKALVTLGSVQYHKLQLAENKKDIETLMKRENVVELEYALESATTFGMSTLMEDIPKLFKDYSEKISHSNCSIAIIHGEADPMFPIQSMRELQADYPDRIDLFEIEDAGFTVLLSHTEQVVNLLSGLVKDVDSRFKGML